MKNDKQQPTFYFHDYETFGISPAYDRPSQFAGVRTDYDFNIIEEPLVIYCQPPDDYLPDPQAVLITGITPQIAKKKGVNEAEFARQIHHAFSQENTCIVGYNNIRFDDEVSRNLFYRNFYDPYAYSWQNKNSRWDLLDVLRACYALRPEGIEWPLNSDGLPSFKLEHLTKANNIEHLHAHDAMSDVYATIAIAKLIKQKQPRLFDYLFELRSKHKVTAMIDIVEMTPLVHISGMFGALRNNTSLVSPIAWHPDNQNAVIVCDLSQDISPLLELDANTLRERLYTRKTDLSTEELPIPIKLIHINKCPVIAPIKTLLRENIQRLEIDQQYCLENLTKLRQNRDIRQKIATLFTQTEPFPSATNVDGMLYDGFFSHADRAAMNIIQKTAPEKIPLLSLTFIDQRLDELLFRYRARNYPSTLTDNEQHRWLAHRKAYFNEQYLQEYILNLNKLFELNEHDETKVKLLKSLFNYCKEIFH